MFVTKSQEGRCTILVHSPHRLEGGSGATEIASLPLVLGAKVRSGEEHPAEGRSRETNYSCHIQPEQGPCHAEHVRPPVSQPGDNVKLQKARRISSRAEVLR